VPPGMPPLGEARHKSRRLPDFPIMRRTYAAVIGMGARPEEGHVSGAFLRADEGTRTLDLLHGKWPPNGSEPERTPSVAIVATVKPTLVDAGL